MKWPGLIPLLGRIIALPVVLVWWSVCVIWCLLIEGLEWWADRGNKDQH